MIQRRLVLPPAPAPPLVDLPLHTAPPGDDSPFLRPKTRTRIRRARRGWIARTALVLQLGGALSGAVLALWTGYAKVMASEQLKIGRAHV